MRLPTAGILMLTAFGLVACTTEPEELREDAFQTNTLSAYEEDSDDGTVGFFTITGGELVGQGNGNALHARLIRRNVTILDGRVEIDTDHISNGIILFRYQDGGTFYMVSVRDDEASYFNMTIRNIELYRRMNGVFTSLARVDIDLPRGVEHTVAVEFVGPAITVFVDEGEVLSFQDASIAAAGGIAVGFDDQLIPGEQSFFEALRWEPLD